MKKNKIQEQKRTRRTLWWKIPLGLLLVVFVALVVVVMNVNSIAHSQANQALENFLSTGGVLDDIDVEVMSGRIKLSGLVINQPQGYGADPFLSLDTLELDIDPLTLVSDEIIIEKLTLAGASLTLVRDKQGQFSFGKLISSSGDISNPQSAEESKEESQLLIPAIRVNSIHLENISIRLLDQLTGEQWSASLRIDLDVNDLQLKDLLDLDILVGKINLALSEIEVDQPPGFGTDKLARLENFTLLVDKLDLASADYIIKQVLLQGLDISMIVHEDGVSNFQKLNSSLFGVEEPPSENTASVATESVPPTVLFEQIQVQNGSFTYRDETLTDDGLVFPFNHIEMKATQLRLYDDNTAATPAAISMSFKLDQPDELATAYFGSVVTLGPVGDGVPMINGQVRLAGLKLDTFGSLVSRKVRTSLGASGLDAGLALALDVDTIKMEAAILTDRNIHYDALKMQGDLDSPSVEVAAFMAGFGRITGGVFNLGKGSLHAGVGVAKEGLGLTKDVGAGAFKIGKNLEENLFKTGMGLITFDKQRLGEGLDSATRGTASLTAGSVQGAGGHTTGGLKGLFSNLTGKTALQAWDKGIPVRYQAAMEQAQEELAGMPYPPVTD